MNAPRARVSGNGNYSPLRGTMVGNAASRREMKQALRADISPLRPISPTKAPRLHRAGACAHSPDASRPWSPTGSIAPSVGTVRPAPDARLASFPTAPFRYRDPHTAAETLPLHSVGRKLSRLARRSGAPQHLPRIASTMNSATRPLRLRCSLRCASGPPLFIALASPPISV